MTDWFLIGVKIYITVIVVGAVVVPVIFYSVGFTPAIALGALSRFRRPSRSVLLKKLIFGRLTGSGMARFHRKCDCRERLCHFAIIGRSSVVACSRWRCDRCVRLLHPFSLEEHVG